MKLDSYTDNRLYIKKESRYLGYRPFYNRFIKIESCNKNRVIKLDFYTANRLYMKKESISLGYRPFYNRYIKLDSHSANRNMKLDGFTINNLINFIQRKNQDILDIDLSVIDLLS